MNLILPKSLELAARTCSEPKWIGEIVIALVSDIENPRLDHGQKTVIAMCRQKLTDRAAKRAAWTERKRRSRKGGAQ